MNAHTNAVKNKIPLTIDCKDAIKYLRYKGRIDYLVSNPPYINEDNFNKSKNIYRWESKKALVALEHGLFFYKHFINWLDKHTFKEAWFEIGYDLVQPLKELSKQYPELNFEFPENRQYLIVKRKL